jgi:hypothetical protein
VAVCQVRRAGHNRALGFKQRFQSAIDTYLCVAIVV